MAITYSLALVYCSETDVFRYGAYVWDESSCPTDDEVYDYAQDVAAQVEAKTEKAGSLINPTSAQTESTRIKRLLEETNAIGAAMKARFHMFRKTSDPADLRVAESLAQEFEARMGEGSALGGEDTGGTITDAVGSAAGTNTLANEVTEGEITLKALTTRTNVEPEFTIEDAE